VCEWKKDRTRSHGEDYRRIERARKTAFTLLKGKGRRPFQADAGK
jgi:hypothetical protein